MKPTLCLLVLFISMFAFSNQKSISDTPNLTTTNDPSMDTSTTSLFTRIFQILVNTIFMLFVVVFTFILALLLIGLAFLAIYKIRIYRQFREFQIAERRRRHESLNDILMRQF